MCGDYTTNKCELGEEQYNAGQWQFGKKVGGARQILSGVDAEDGEGNANAGHMVACCFSCQVADTVVEMSRSLRSPEYHRHQHL